MSTAPHPINQQLDDAWDLTVARLAAMAEVVRNDPLAADPAMRAAGYRYLLNLVNAALETKVFSADRAFPEHGRLQDTTKRYATESADCLFGVSSLDPAGTYRVTGEGGSAHFVGMTLYRDMRLGDQADLLARSDYDAVFKAATGSTLGALSSPGGLEIVDGRFEVILSAERPEGARNWLHLPPETDHVITRQYFYDWDTEDAYHVSVERLDPPTPGPVTTPTLVLDQLEDFSFHMSGNARYWSLFYDIKARTKRNILTTQPPLQADYAGDAGYISYGGGYLEIPEDQAVIVEFTPPSAHFWNFHLGDHWAQSMDYTFRQSSLNGHQARLDEQGVFRGVISHVDPGVANWLDTGGNRWLNVIYRWWLAETPDVVTPTVRFVNVAALESELPAGTPRVTPAERQASLERRRRAVLRRYRR